MQAFPVQVKPVWAKPAQEKPFLGKKAPKEGNLGRHLVGRAPCRCVANVPKQRRFSRWQGRCAGMLRVGFAYNFLLGSKTYILVCWAFHLRKPCDVGTHISQRDQNCAFIRLECARIRFADLPPKGVGTVHHRMAFFCTHGTKSIPSLGTQHHQAQQNSIVTHKL